MIMEENDWMPKYDKIKIIVFTENEDEKQKYFLLFKLMLNEQLQKVIRTSDRGELFTDKLELKFFTKKMNARGHKAHFVLNLTQDQEFDNLVAKPITIIHDYLKKDTKWHELFE